jgi:phage terminase large subunit
MELKIQGTALLQQTIDCATRFLIHSGGSRSSKTYSICQFLLIYLLQNKNKTITIVRSTVPALKKSVLKDFIEVMEASNQWNPGNFNKTELIYTFNSNTVEFSSTDDSHKLRGRKRDILWCNEATDIDLESFRQLEMRTKDRIILDWNPSLMDFWGYEIVDQRPGEVTVINSTYRDNPFIGESIIRAIESYKDTDPEFYNVYGNGVRGSSSSLIYPKFSIVEQAPIGTHPTSIGVDFGWTHSTVAIRAHFLSDRTVYEELVYEYHLDPAELVEMMVTRTRQDETLFCDSARPDVIDLLKRAGLDARMSDKSVLDGIASVKRTKIELIGKNIVKEFRNYRWKTDINGKVTDKPIKVLDDGCDAIRYACHNTIKSARTHGAFDYSIVIT